MGDYMILYKWVTPMEDPPSIINSMIAMAMWGEDPNPMLGARLPKTLMAVSMIAVPFMLIPKPIIKLVQHRAQKRAARARAPVQGRGIGRPHVAVSDEEVHALAEKTE